MRLRFFFKEDDGEKASTLNTEQCPRIGSALCSLVKVLGLPGMPPHAPRLSVHLHLLDPNVDLTKLELKEVLLFHILPVTTLPQASWFSGSPTGELVGAGQRGGEPSTWGS